MKRSAVLISIFILIGSCSKTDTISNEIRKCDCSFYLPPQEEVNDPVNLCQNDTCQNYFKIWKELFLERNQMTEDYFNIHIIPFNTSLQHWNDGISFRIQFKVKIDWMEVKMNENFIIWLSPSTEGLYASLNIPRSTLLSKDLVKRTIDNYAFNSLKFDVSPINNLKYKSRTEAKKALIKASAVDTR